MPSISFVVAKSWPGNVIGRNNTLPWKLTTDLKRFRLITSGHPIIMGRNTYESIGRPLPGRNNIIITRREIPQNDKYLFRDGDTTLNYVNSPNDALFLADCYAIARGKADIFVIGGDQMYKIYGELMNKLYLTMVFAGDIEGDAFFDSDHVMNKVKWKMLHEEEVPKSEFDEYPSRYCIFERRIKTVRQFDVRKYFSIFDYKNPEFISKARRYAEQHDAALIDETVDLFDNRFDIGLAKAS